MIIATAGHIDHGKTLLVKAITGEDADRLPEEKKRGMTIDLGFAYQQYQEQKVIGFVDVPGHERFIGNMLAGVTGIDYALLVIASDDGPMPQTKEHLAILDILGISEGAVALTKIDRVESSRIEEVTKSTTSLLSSTNLNKFPIFPVSSVTGQGIKTLTDHLLQVTENTKDRMKKGGFRLAIDRAFIKPGVGLVVTGTIFSGQIKVGDQVYLTNTMRSARVRDIRANNQSSEDGSTGQRCAINLTGIDKELVRRGDWVVSNPLMKTIKKIDVSLRILENEKRPFKHWTSVHIHLGAADVTGRVALLNNEKIPPGEASLAQLVLDTPIGAVAGDRFIIRDQSAQRTVGGGHVIDIFSPNRGRARKERVKMLEALNNKDDSIALEKALNLSPSGLDLELFSITRNLPVHQATKLAIALEAIIISPNQRTIALSKPIWEILRDETLSALDKYHLNHSNKIGPSLLQLSQNLKRKLMDGVFSEIVNSLVDQNIILSDGMFLYRPNRKPVLDQKDLNLWKEIQPIITKTPFQPPVIHDLANEIGKSPEMVMTTLRQAAKTGFVIQVGKNRFFETSAIKSLANIFSDLSQSETQGVSPRVFKDQTKIGRNLTIEILEFFDRSGLSKREGNTRKQIRPVNEVFPGPEK
ncbi:MAG: selenocysteine-specific translation elongation factor [Alphaproteobacteria bacterium]|jgi:selenocysteine-specific elongation factor|nr:selenocysteine-specific translation elongation factor [Alphaproteobacteria bacterium]PPR13885.1 MAG: Selenocysteine-specific elongation factor [Alphaproteobacteria bacterium MarineAlpha12_Bin1]|tara:strand:+ start:14853 stop:16775 length:1923 start_codon:yes stop_codon:yes gene_type:complete